MIDKEGFISIEVLTLPQRARIFATAAHAAVGQKRKYTGEDYIVHPAGVVDILTKALPDVTSEMIAAAWLHDVIEDTKVTEEQIYKEFGDTVARYVVGLSKVSVPQDGNRKSRMEKDCLFLSHQCPAVQTIKVADLIHNTSSIVEHDTGFARVYLAEKYALLKVLIKADAILLSIAHSQVINSTIELNTK